MTEKYDELEQNSCSCGGGEETCNCEHENCNCEHDHEHEASFDMFSITDEQGEEHNFALISELPYNGKVYWVCQEAVLTEEGGEFNEDSYIVFRAETDEEGNVNLDSLDDAEFEEVSKEWDKLVDEMLSEEGVDFEEVEDEE